MFYGLPEFKVAESIEFTENMFMVFTKLVKAVKVRRK
jgi:hypothetical protein